MISGKTSEKILVGGTYNCNSHPLQEATLIKDDLFPRCAIENHETTWTLKESNETKKSDEEQDQDINKKIETIEDHKEKLDEVKRVLITNTELLYKKKGFFAAINFKRYKDETYSLKGLINDERNLIHEKIKDLKQIYDNKIKQIEDKYEELKIDLDEKNKLKEEFEKELELMQAEFKILEDEIKKCYLELRDEIKKIGANKEGLISKRIEEFEKEINKIIDVYQNIEKTQNKKFKDDFEARKFKDDDKQFYYNYREKLEKNFNEVQYRLRILEKEGLNATVSRFLISTGWISALVSSWYFNLWYSGDKSQNTNILVHILDGIRLFTQKHPWWLSITVFLGYILAILLISKLCHSWAVKRGFINVNNVKENSKDNIEVNLEKDNILKAKFNANSWYEMWLKITPAIAIVFLLVIILALDTIPDKSPLYEGMSESHYLQFIGFILPLSTAPIIYLYITKVIENRYGTQNEFEKDNKTKNWRFSWELSLILIFFILLIVLFIIIIIKPQFININQIGAWGFFIGCLSTGFALGYGFRYKSLSETYNILFDDSHLINRYIENKYYAPETSYIKDGGVIVRMHNLYHSLLSLLEARNNLGVLILNPHFKVKPNKTNLNEKNTQIISEFEKSNDEKREELANETLQNQIQTDWFTKLKIGLTNLLKEQAQKYGGLLKGKDKKIKELKNELNEQKKDNIDIEELTYFPESGAIIKQFKALIEKRERRLIELREELEGKYKNEKTYAIIMKQIENVKNSAIPLEKLKSKFELDLNSSKNNLTSELKIIETFITEGYNLGEWYANNHEPSI